MLTHSPGKPQDPESEEKKEEPADDAEGQEKQDFAEAMDRNVTARQPAEECAPQSVPRPVLLTQKAIEGPARKVAAACATEAVEGYATKTSGDVVAVCAKMAAKVAVARWVEAAEKAAAPQTQSQGGDESQVEVPGNLLMLPETQACELHETGVSQTVASQHNAGIFAGSPEGRHSQERKGKTARENFQRHDTGPTWSPRRMPPPSEVPEQPQDRDMEEMPMQDVGETARAMAEAETCTMHVVPPAILEQEVGQTHEMQELQKDPCDVSEQLQDNDKEHEATEMLTKDAAETTGAVGEAATCRVEATPSAILEQEVGFNDEMEELQKDPFDVKTLAEKDLKSLNYKELVALAKHRGVKANGKKAWILRRLQQFERQAAKKAATGNTHRRTSLR